MYGLHSAITCTASFNLLRHGSFCKNTCSNEGFYLYVLSFSHMSLCKSVCIAKTLCLQKFCLFRRKQDWRNFSSLTCWRVSAFGDPWQYLGFLLILALCTLKLKSREWNFLFIGTKFAGWCLHKSLATPVYALNPEPSRRLQQGPSIWADRSFLCI